MDKSSEPTLPLLDLGKSRVSGDRRKSTPYKRTVVTTDEKDQEPGQQGQATLTISPSLERFSPPQAIMIRPTPPPHSPDNCLDDTSESTTYDACISPNMGPVKTTKRRLFSRRQLNGLKESFQRNAYPSKEEYDRLATSLNMKESSVKQWFQNARAKLRKRGSLSSATKTFYLDRTEPLSLPASTSPDFVSAAPIENPGVAREKIPLMTSAIPPTQPVTPFHTRDSLKRKIASVPQMVKKEEPPAVIRIEPIVEEERLVSRVGREGPSDEEGESTSPSSTTSRKSGGMSSPTVPASSPGTYQTMTQVALPSDHPFCNLGVGMDTKRRRRRPSPSVVNNTPWAENLHPADKPLAQSAEKKRRCDSDSDEDPRGENPVGMPPHRPLPMYLPAPYMQAMQQMQMQMQMAREQKATAPAIGTERHVKPTMPEGVSSEDAPLDLSTGKERDSRTGKDGRPDKTENAQRTSPSSRSTPPSGSAPSVHPMPVYGQPPYMFPMYPMMPMPLAPFPGYGSQVAWAMPKWATVPSKVHVAK